jgi:hypothetical protein
MSTACKAMSIAASAADTYFKSENVNVRASPLHSLSSQLESVNVNDDETDVFKKQRGTSTRTKKVQIKNILSCLLLVRNYTIKYEDFRLKLLASTKHAHKSRNREKEQANKKGKTGKTSKTVIKEKFPGLSKWGLANCRSIANKATLICDFIVSNSLDALIITETWLRGDSSDQTLLLDCCPSNFMALGFPRLNKRGGGLGGLFRRELSMSVLPMYDGAPNSFECAMCQLQLPSRKLVIVLIYRPPSSSLTTFLSEMSDLFAYLNPFQSVIVLGDFNITDLNQLNPLLEMFSFQQHIEQPTHVKGNSLDLILSRMNHPDLVSNFDIVPGLSDHFAILFNLCVKFLSTLSAMISTTK